MSNEDSLLTPETALASYGTLAPGESNHWMVRSLGGEWLDGTVRGWLFEITWGELEGYPGIALDPGAPEVSVHVLVADQLPKKWRELDDFEGPGYRRVSTTVTRPNGTTFDASIYEALTDND